MRKTIATTICCVGILAVALVASPTNGPTMLRIAGAEAAVSKSMQGGAVGGTNLGNAGEHLGTEISDFGVPAVIAVAGFLLIGALATRNIGASVGVVVITLLALIFLQSPESIEGLAKGVASSVF
jgi:hypothetical protein